MDDDDDDGIAPLSHHVAAGAPLRYHVAAGPPLLTAGHLEAKWLEPKWLGSKRLEQYRSNQCGPKYLTTPTTAPTQTN